MRGSFSSGADAAAADSRELGTVRNLVCERRDIGHGYSHGGMNIKRVIGPLIGAVVTAIALAGAAGAIPEQGTPEFEVYLQALQRNGFNLNPDTAWRVAHQACEGGIPGFIGYELLAQGVIGPGAQQRLMNVAMQYACPVQ